MRNMRVTVCFGQTRVIVPCKGGATVAELVKEATARYKRAIGKTPKYWVKIRQLENAVDGGILDADDYVYDVAEDRDQLIAIFEEEDDQTYRPSYNGWDRHSGSGSDGHRSPPAFQNHPVLNNRYSNDNSPSNRAQAPTGNATVIKRNSKREPALEVNVGVEALKSSSNSQITVRRGSGQMLDFDGGKNEIQSLLKNPTLSHQYYGRRESGSGQEEEDSLNQVIGNNRAHEIMITTTSNSSPEQNLSVVTASSDTNISVDSGHHSIKGKYSQDGKNYSNFVRGNTRHSMMGVLSEKNDNDIYEGSRQPPDGRKENSHGYLDYSGSYQAPHNVERYLPPPPVDDSIYPKFYNESQEMFVDIDERPLGVKVTRYRDRKIFCGLLVESVDEGGRSEREGLLQAGDVIVEINNYVLAQYSHSIAQEIFKNAMKFPELQLRVYPVEERERASVAGNAEDINNALNSKHRHTPSIPVLSLVEATPPKASKLSSAKSLPDLNASISSKSLQDVSSNGKVSLSARMSLDTLSNNTRKIGNMFEIKLRKGEQGLGFSITTRDTSIGDPGPIYIKNILPKGAAIQDGRLHAGDRLLKVNDIELTGHTQESAVSILRQIQVGDEASLVVSRHTHIMPRKMKDDPVADKVLSDDSHREHFKFEIALNDTGSAGLGISLKGNQSKKTKKDLGIFVKAVFHGGAAYQDGRLQPNDQLISVNGQSLFGMTNHEAIDTLRTSMSTVGNVRGMIQMVVARRKHVPGDPMSPQFSSEASSEMSDSLINERTGSSRTSFEITGHSKNENSVEDSFRYNEEIPQQIDPNPLDSFADRSLEDSMTMHNVNWTPSPEIQDPELDPFNRENIFRQSVSEKRRGGGASTRDAQSTDTFKALKNKQMTNDLVAGKKSPSPEVPKSPTVAKSLKWIKPSSSMRSDNSTRSSPLPHTPKSPTRRSPRVAKRNLNNSSNLPGFQDGTGHENKRSHTPLSFDYRSVTPSSLSNISAGSGHYLSKNNINESPTKSFPPPDYVNITPKSSKKSVGPTYSEDAQSPPVPVVRKSNSSDSLMTFGLYSKQPPPSPVSKPQSSPAKSTSSRGVPYLKPPVLPYSDLKHLAACCTPMSSVGNLTSPSYDRRPHPLTARRETSNIEPEVAVGPTLGIAKSSSLESLQTAVENYVDNKDSQYLKPQPRVIRGRVLNESFRAALDQSYDMESLGRKPMATLKEEGNGTSPLARTDGQKTHEKKRAGKSYKIFGIFRVGKNKRSMSSDRNLDTSAPRVPESEVHKRLLESKREDDFKKHQAETERIQAKAKAMREQQELRKKDDEKYRSREDLVDSNEFERRARAPSVPVTAMQRMDIDPKVSYAETPSGRRSVDPSAMRDGSHQSQPFELYMAKRPTSPVDYGDRNRHRRYEKRSNVNKVKTTPDYSSLPRQPRLEPNAGALPVNPDRVVTAATGTHSQVKSPNSASRVQGRSSENFSNQEFYNMQKPPGSKRQSAEPKLRSKQPERNTGSMTERQGRPEKVKAGRALYYDDTDSSVSPSNSFRNKTPQSQPRPRNNTQGKPRSKNRPVSVINGYGASPNTFHREESPEPPPVMYRNAGSPQSGPYRHSVHVDAQVSRQYDVYSARSRNRKQEPPSFKWKTELGRRNNDQSDSDSYRTSSPASSGNAERNRIAAQKMLRTREQQDPERIVISPPYNL